MAFHKSKINYGYQFPSYSDPYVYLKMLETPQNNFEANILAAAKKMLNNVDERALKKDDNNTEKALTFLHTVAENQRQRELNFIEDKIKQLQQFDSEWAKRVAEELKPLKNKGQPFDYNAFIVLLNDAMKGINAFKQRLEELKEHNEKRFRLSQRMVEGVSATVTNYTRTRSRFYYAQEELIRMLTMKFLTRTSEVKEQVEKILADDFGAANFVALNIVIQQKLIEYLKNKGIDLQTEKYYNTQEDFMADLQKYMQLLDDFDNDTNISAIFDRRNLEQAREIFNVEETDSVVSRGNKNSGKIAAEQDAIMQKLGIDKINMSQTIMNQLKRIKVSFRSDKKLSIEREVASAVEIGINGFTAIGARGGGTDSFYFGSLTVDLPPSEKQERDSRLFKQLDKLKKEVYNQDTFKDAEKKTRAYEEEIKKLDEILADYGKSFLVHETTKFYTTPETKGRMRYKEGYRGRELMMLSYLDDLAQIGTYFGIKTDWLKFYAYNLATDALGAESKNSLERIFAIVAGLLMFDDFSNIAKDAAQELVLSNLENIHLYRLQDMYFPTSYFLEETYKTMLAGYENFLSFNGMSVQIKVPTINYEEKYGDYDERCNNELERRFKEVKEMAEQNTKINISFGAAFLDLIDRLQIPK